MKSGDYVKSAGGHIWTVAFCGDVSALCPELPGRRAFVIRPLMAEHFDDLQYAYLAEDEIVSHVDGPIFKPGQFLQFEDEILSVHRVEPMFVLLMRSDGTFTSAWRWQLALLKHRKKRLSFVNADLLAAEPEQV